MKSVGFRSRGLAGLMRYTVVALDIPPATGPIITGTGATNGSGITTRSLTTDISNQATSGQYMETIATFGNVVVRGFGYSVPS